MPFLAYIAIILVSLGGILFELNWLTSPKLETKPAVQASKSAPPPKVAAAPAAPREEETSASGNEVAAGPRNVAPNVTMVPGAAVAPKAAEAAPVQPETNAPPQQTASAPAIIPAPTASAPAITPAPMGAASASTNAAALSPTETTGAGSTDFKREFSTDAKADSTTSSATFTPAITTPAAAAPATPAVAASATNKCDIAACSAAYQSFRASDCSYQPMDGSARKVCDRTQSGAQQASAPAPEQKAGTVVRHDAGRTQNKDAGKEAKLRAFERDVRRITASEANLDSGYDRGRSQVIVIERRDW